MFCSGYGIVGNGFGGAGFLMMIPMLILFFAAVYYIFRAISSRNRNFAVIKVSSEALDILNERFARGEINEEEYRSIKSQLLR